MRRLMYLVFLGVLLASNATSQTLSDVIRFSRELQGFVNNNKIKLEKKFTFAKVKDSLLWVEQPDIRSYLEERVIPDPMFQDSIGYDVVPYEDKEGDSVIIDVHKGWKIGDVAFITPYLFGEFVGGIRKFSNELTAHLTKNITTGSLQTNHFFLLFDNEGGLLSVRSDDDELTKVVASFWQPGQKRLRPPVRYGRPFYSIFRFDILFENENFQVDNGYVSQHDIHSIYTPNDTSVYLLLGDVKKMREGIPAMEVADFVYDIKNGKDQLFQQLTSRWADHKNEQELRALMDLTFADKYQMLNKSGRYHIYRLQLPNAHRPENQ